MIYIIYIYIYIYIIASTLIANTEIFAFIAILLFKLLSSKVFYLQTAKAIETVLK